MWAFNSLQIFLENDRIVLAGDSSSSSGQVIRGHVALNIRYPTKITSIELSLKGWCSGEAAAEHFLRHHVSLLEESQANEFPPGRYEYHFEFPLPGDSPESMSCSLTSIKYMFNAVAKRVGYWGDLHAEKELLVKRIDGAQEEIQSLYKVGEFHSRFGFCLFSPSSSYKPGDSVFLHVGTQSLGYGNQVHRIRIGLIESVSRRTHGRKEQMKTLLHEVSTSWLPIGHRQWYEEIVFPTSSMKSSIHPDCQNEYVSISHELNLTFTFSDINGSKREVAVRTPLKFLPQEMPDSEEGLPEYSTAIAQPPSYFSSSYLPLYF
ncbi:hypothetical protein K493DRAFT_307434 [Basidiobolus meristosporus CBS 931.73]|uniref:Uncharacterized protein n=1 Tax=Basidiobolus meristosporus CBS 931.73 TaxID=1314790 RepID=A0A1Y1XFM3_9FUNG|nr:hypothetical protein K493DRAFT_307434 [Basidiobolus meristosporus CBS 931.73]|eukprot:ORX84517.1 hypothetical protein K493DRAFT_307434 [Basidiobolus meristosporus CBS 931.73]